MQENSKDTIIVEDVYKTFNVYMDKANTIKEKLMFFRRNKKEKREVLKGINLQEGATTIERNRQIGGHKA